MFNRHISRDFLIFPELILVVFLTKRDLWISYIKLQWFMGTSWNGSNHRSNSFQKNLKSVRIMTKLIVWTWRAAVHEFPCSILHLVSPWRNFSNFFLKTMISVISVQILVWVSMRIFYMENINYNCAILFWSQLYCLFIHASKYIFQYKKNFLIDAHVKIWTEITDRGRNYWSSCRVLFESKFLNSWNVWLYHLTLIEMWLKSEISLNIWVDS